MRSMTGWFTLRSLLSSLEFGAWNLNLGIFFLNLSPKYHVSLQIKLCLIPRSR